MPLSREEKLEAHLREAMYAFLDQPEHSSLDELAAVTACCEALSSLLEWQRMRQQELEVEAAAD
jgi:hypothetical protein